MKIGICDDEYYIVKALEKMIKTSLKDDMKKTKSSRKGYKE